MGATQLKQKVFMMPWALRVPAAVLFNYCLALIAVNTCTYDHIVSWS